MNNAKEKVEQGDVGAGTGTVCFGLISDLIVEGKPVGILNSMLEAKTTI